MKKIKIIKSFIIYSILSSCLFLGGFLITHGVGLEDRVYVHDYDEGYLDLGLFAFRDDELSGSGSMYYKGSFSGTGGFTVRFSHQYYGKARKAVTSSGYVGLLGGWGYNDEFGFMSLNFFGDDSSSAYHDAKNANSIYANHTRYPELKDIGQGETGYGVWIDWRGHVYGKGHINDEPFNSLNSYFTGSTLWRPIPFDKDGDGLSDELESLYFPGINDSGNQDGDLTLDGASDWDTDGDGWSDGEEMVLGTDPLSSSSKPNDGDGDFLSDYYDTVVSAGTCIGGIDAGDDCDGDGLTNREEQQYGTDPTQADTDGDGISDGIEAAFGQNPLANQPDLDTDGDGLLDRIEIAGVQVNSGGVANTVILDPYRIDTDDDFLDDLFEYSLLGSDPANPDTDGDTIPDYRDPSPLKGSLPDNDPGDDWSDEDGDLIPKWWEDKFSRGSTGGVIIMQSGTVNGNLIKYELNDLNLDSDGDLILDGDEDFDMDGLTNYQEYLYGTDPNNWDSDGDGIGDEQEVDSGLDPNNNDDGGNNDGDAGDNQVSCESGGYSGLSNSQEVNGFNITVDFIDGSGTSTGYTSHVILDPNSKDSDSDGLGDVLEISLGSNPADPDTDGDGVIDGIEFNLGQIDPTNSNPGHLLDGTSTPQDDDGDLLYDIFEDRYTNGAKDYEKRIATSTGTLSGNTISLVDYKLSKINPNSDGDFLSDAVEDFDRDGFTNYQEQVNSTDPNNWDSDFDGISDGNEFFAGLNPLDPSDARQDFDGDGILNIDEINGYEVTIVTYHGACGLGNPEDTQTLMVFSDPMKADTDMDGLQDGWEQANNLNPVSADTDRDLVIDGIEIRLGSDPKNSIDTPVIEDDDGDGLPNDFDPYVNNGDGDGDRLGDAHEDGDGDGLTDLYEYLYGTDPENSDSDEDGISDGDEINNGLDPTNYIDAFQDNDGDGISNLDEINGSEFNLIIVCNGGTSTGKLVTISTNPNNWDTDFDGSRDGDELGAHMTNPTSPDTDLDGVLDGIEINLRAWDPNPEDGDNADPLSADSGSVPFPGYPEDDYDLLYNIFENLFSRGGSGGIIYTTTGTMSALTGEFDLLVDSPESNGDQTGDGREDFDEDMLSNYIEELYGFDPNNWDSDGDGIGDFDELANGLNGANAGCTSKDPDGDMLLSVDEIAGFTYNLNYKDTEGIQVSGVQIFVTDPSNMDTDGDGISDYNEINGTYSGRTLVFDPTNPTHADTDGDGIGDGVEISIGRLEGDAQKYVLDGTAQPEDSDCDGIYDTWNDKYGGGCLDDPYADCDGDGLSNLEEQMIGTDPSDIDTDDDGINDRLDPYPFEKCNRSSECTGDPDSDFDRISDLEELSTWTGTITLDGDVITKRFATHWAQFDTDCDGLFDGYERNTKLHPLDSDHDNDYFKDGAEVTYSSFKMLTDSGVVISGTGGIFNDPQFGPNIITIEWKEFFNDFKIFLNDL